MSKIHIYYANIVNKETALPEPFLSKYLNSGCASRKNEITSTYLLFKQIGLDVNSLHYDENGKPLLNNQWISISHDEEMVVIATSDTNIGVDILSEDKQYDLVQKSLGIDSKEQFMKTWVVIESFMKYLGLGLKAGYKNIKVNIDGDTLLYKGELMNVEFITNKIGSHYLGVLSDSIDEVIFDKIEL